MRKDKNHKILRENKPPADHHHFHNAWRLFCRSDSAGFNKVFKLVSAPVDDHFNLLCLPHDREARCNSLSVLRMCCRLYCMQYTLASDFSPFMEHRCFYSALQWFMDVESLLLCLLFHWFFHTARSLFPRFQNKMYRVLGHAVFMLILIFVIGYFVNLACSCACRMKGKNSGLVVLS